MSYRSGWTCACCSSSWNVKICHSACSRTRSQIPGRKGRGPRSRRRWRAAGPGSSAQGEEPADWAPFLPWCQSHPLARPRKTELAATGSLGTGKGAEGKKQHALDGMTRDKFICLFPSLFLFLLTHLWIYMDCMCSHMLFIHCTVMCGLIFI